MTLRKAWEEHARDWLRFARTPGHDHFYERFNLPAFLELLPPPGRAALDLGCGEGRLGKLLVERGYRIVGVDASPTLAEAAREHHEVLEADAAALPFEDGAFDLVYAFMSLHDMDDLEGAVRESGRVLERGGRFCFAVEHPLQKSGRWVDPDDPESPFVVDRPYLRPRRFEDVRERDGIRMTFVGLDRPLSAYAAALEAAGLLIEAVREPVPPSAYAAEYPRAAKWGRIPGFLQVRAVKP